MKDQDAAYIAGFFDADGSVSYFPYRATKNGKEYWRLQAKITQKHPEVLNWIAKVADVGTVGGHNSGHHAHDFIVTARAARTFLAYILPYLRVKREKVLECLELDANRTPRRPICKNGWSNPK